MVKGKQSTSTQSASVTSGMEHVARTKGRRNIRPGIFFAFFFFTWKFLRMQYSCTDVFKIKYEGFEVVSTCICLYVLVHIYLYIRLFSFEGLFIVVTIYTRVGRILIFFGIRIFVAKTIRIFELFE